MAYAPGKTCVGSRACVCSSLLADQPGQEFRDLWIEQEKPGDAQFLGQCPFFLQTFPVVKEDEVGPGLPAHVGEVVGAEVGEKNTEGGSGGAAAALRFPGRWAGPAP